MNAVIEQMLKPYEAQTLYDKENAIKEVVQEIVLCGLSRAGFFQHAAFYGGTALRIFYGLDRFSEDLDFSMKAPDANFDLAAFLPTLEKEVRSYGLNFKIEAKEKSVDSGVKSAFLKGNTKEHILMFYADEHLAPSIAASKLIKVKFEVDTNPPAFATFERKYRLLPIPYEINLYDMPSLFAGKIHAVICRSWKTRVKGRDLYDYVFYLSRGTSVNLRHLWARLTQSDFIEAGKTISLDEVKDMLYKRFEQIDYEQAKQDVLPFIRNPDALALWSADFFKRITESLK
ncbi:MAG: nucleotidyl transferase AbiEii/AbiGii toxin family protein [Clostridia bacterium]|nr:nucleotidyl transferase AbiEii/AbiGii toxin family protein [Clostridia bacterium]